MLATSQISYVATTALRLPETMEVLLFCLLSLLPCPGSAMTVMETLATRFDLITFTNLIRSSNLDKVLNSVTGHFMVFVPLDSAFSRLPQNYMKMLHDSQNPNLIPDLVKYHIVPYTGQLNTNWTGNRMTTLLGKPIRILTGKINNQTVVNGVIMTDANLTASNGHIFLVEEVLSPPQDDIYTSLANDDRFTTFLSAVLLAGMGNKLQEEKITVFAPTNTAFQSLTQNKSDSLFNSHNALQALVHYYVVPEIYYTRAIGPSQALQVPNASCYHPTLRFVVGWLSNVRLYPGPIPIAQADWLANNGVIQVMERVVLPTVSCHHQH